MIQITGFPPFKDLFKTFSRLNYLVIKTQVDKIWTNFDEASGRQKANQRIWNDVPWILNDQWNIFLSRWQFSRLFPDFIREITEFQTFSRPLNFFSEFQIFSRFFQTVGTPRLRPIHCRFTGGIFAPNGRFCGRQCETLLSTKTRAIL
jgi:hypothetical protein